jgi:cytochrome c oxidase cbb3-type subunit 3
VNVVQPDGTAFSGELAYEDEFTVALFDADGRYRSWPAASVRYEVVDPLQAHVAQLAVYTDDDIHDVFAYLQSLMQE